ncbi:MAG TPA: hypothetical protein P5522_08250 [Spirochaetia bacterium]|nr:hypothetical protein [Spirochaetia bacterium]
MKRKLIVSIILFTLALGAFAGDFAFPSLYLLSNGYFDANESFIIATQFDFSLAFRSQTNLATEIVLSFYTNSLEDYFLAEQTPLTVTNNPDDLANSLGILNAQNFAGIKRIAITIPQIFVPGISASFFSGHYDALGSKTVVKKAGTYKALLPYITDRVYMPLGINNTGLRWYEGIHPVFGTGLKLSYTGKSFETSAYIYQDSWIGNGYYSSDIRFMVFSPHVSLDVFGGISFPQGPWGLYRMGLFFNYNTGDIAEITAQIGVPYWMSGTALTMDMFYFMLEPRVNFGAGYLTLAIFFHPGYFAQQETHESGMLDFKAALALGSLEKGGLQSGIEALLRLNPNVASNQFSMAVSPFISMNQAKTQWQVKLSMAILPILASWYTMFSPSVMVQILE